MRFLFVLRSIITLLVSLSLSFSMSVNLSSSSMNANTLKAKNCSKKLLNIFCGQRYENDYLTMTFIFDVEKKFSIEHVREQNSGKLLSRVFYFILLFSFFFKRTILHLTVIFTPKNNFSVGANMFESKTLKKLLSKIFFFFFFKQMDNENIRISLSMQ